MYLKRLVSRKGHTFSPPRRRSLLRATPLSPPRPPPHQRRRQQPVLTQRLQCPRTTVVAATARILVTYQLSYAYQPGSRGRKYIIVVS